MRFRLQISVESVSPGVRVSNWGHFELYENLQDIDKFMFITGVNYFSDKLFTG
jgi:hypothetical protein